MPADVRSPKFLVGAAAAACLLTAVAVPLANTAKADEATTTVVAAGSGWRYHDGGVDLGVSWREASYSDTAWKSGKSEFGYGDGDEATVVTGKRPTYYFRTSFHVPDASAVTALNARAIIDDAAVVYLNGVEVWRKNITANPTFRTLATTYVAGAAESTWNMASLPTGALKDDRNVIAVEVHNDALTSSDISFNMQLDMTATTEVAVPATPSPPTASTVGPDSVAFQWPSVAGAADYVVYRNGSQVGVTSTTTYTDTGLAAGTSYTYTVAARNASGASAPSAGLTVSTPAESIKTMCRIDNPQLREISGLAASVRHPGVLWTHNDSGDKAQVYAVDATTCQLKATIALSGVGAYDFESISVGRDAQGNPEIWVGDTGDNAKARANVKLYRFPEPVTLTDQTVPVKTVTMTWSDGKRDSEGLIVEPVPNGRIYLVSKEWNGGIYQLQGDFRTTGTATLGTRLAKTPASYYATDAAVAPDNSSMIIRYGNNFATIRNGLIGTSERLVATPTQGQGEAITYSLDGRYVYIASEGATDLIRIPVSAL